MAETTPTPFELIRDKMARFGVRTRIGQEYLTETGGTNKHGALYHEIALPVNNTFLYSEESILETYRAKKKQQAQRLLLDEDDKDILTEDVDIAFKLTDEAGNEVIFRHSEILAYLKGIYIDRTNLRKAIENRKKLESAKAELELMKTPAERKKELQKMIKEMEGEG